MCLLQKEVILDKIKSLTDLINFPFINPEDCALMVFFVLINKLIDSKLM